ncbi:hypothetical protein FRB95_006583 [Tulasnella sp. JGI-2019a]|nr:hypothetical protein FRB95_006583 [Tulasnella sp. JGI-2019a]
MAAFHESSTPLPGIPEEPRSLPLSSVAAPAFPDPTYNPTQFDPTLFTPSKQLQNRVGLLRKMIPTFQFLDTPTKSHQGWLQKPVIKQMPATACPNFDTILIAPIEQHSWEALEQDNDALRASLRQAKAWGNGLEAINSTAHAQLVVQNIVYEGVIKQLNVKE